MGITAFAPSKVWFVSVYFGIFWYEFILVRLGFVRLG